MTTLISLSKSGDICSGRTNKFSRISSSVKRLLHYDSYLNLCIGQFQLHHVPLGLRPENFPGAGALKPYMVNRMPPVAKHDNSCTLKARDLAISEFEIQCYCMITKNLFRKLPLKKSRCSYIPPCGSSIFNHNSTQN